MMIVTSSWISREGDLWVKLRIYLPLLLVTKATFDFVDAERHFWHRSSPKFLMKRMRVDRIAST